MEKQKKPTNAQLQRRLAKAIIHIDATKDTKTIYFSDKGLRLTYNDEYAIIETGYHRHVFSNFTSSGVSEPYHYTKEFVDIALENIDHITIDEEKGGGYSYKRLLDYLKNQEGKKNDYIIAFYCDMYFFTIFNNLYSIGTSGASSFLVYLDYICGIAKNATTLEEHKDGLTNKQFINEFIDKVKDITSDIQEMVIFEPISDEDMIKAEVDAIQEQEYNDNIIKQDGEH